MADALVVRKALLAYYPGCPDIPKKFWSFRGQAYRNSSRVHRCVGVVVKSAGDQVMIYAMGLKWLSEVVLSIYPADTTPLAEALLGVVSDHVKVG